MAGRFDHAPLERADTDHVVFADLLVHIRNPLRLVARRNDAAFVMAL